MIHTQKYRPHDDEACYNESRLSYEIFISHELHPIFKIILFYRRHDCIYVGIKSLFAFGASDRMIPYVLLPILNRFLGRTEGYGKRTQYFLPQKIRSRIF